MDIRVDTIKSAIDIPECISISQIQHTTVQDKYLQCLKNIIIAGWLNTKDEIHIAIRPYWSYRDDLAVINGVVMKGRCIIIPAELKQQVLDQLHLNHMGIKKKTTKLLTHESVYWVNINTDIENHIKGGNTCLEFQQMQPKEKIIHHDIPLRPWEVLGADIFHLNNKNYLYIIDYQSKFPVIKRMEGLSTESLIVTIKVIFVEYGIPCRLMSDAGTNFISEKSSSSAAGPTSSKHCHQHITTRAMDWSKPASHSSSTLKRNAWTPVVTFTWHYYKFILHHRGKVYLVWQHCFLICLVCGVMPVVNRKPSSVDNDDELHIN